MYGKRNVMNDNYIGRRVEIPTHYDLWMQGARFGKIVKQTEKSVFVK